MKKGLSAVGCFFIAIAAFLYATKHITAAIISVNVNTPNANYYEGAYKIIGFGMSFWIFAALLTGIIFLLISLWPSLRKLFIIGKTGEKNAEL
jgi:hypothetical protein